MKLKDVPQGTKIQDIKVRLSDSMYDWFNQFDNDLPREVFLFGPTMGNWFIKINHDDSRIHPLFREHIPWSELSELEVIEIVKPKS